MGDAAEAGALHRLVAVLLLCIAVVLLVGHSSTEAAQPPLHGPALVVAGGIAGLVIGVVAALLGVAGGELLIPTLVLLFAAPIKLAGSLSLAVSLPTMLTGFARYSQDQSFSVLRRSASFVLTMGLGSVVGAFIGGRLLGIVPSKVPIPTLAVILAVSALKVWSHGRSD